MKTQRYQGKAVLITGGATGIGRACALAFAREGAAVAICGPDTPELQATREALERLGPALGIVADIGDPGDVARTITAVEGGFGGLDGLVNNASVVGEVAPVAALNLVAWNETLRVNLTGAMLCCQAAIPALRRRGGGAIVNVSSNVARRGFANRASYVCSKWALNGLTQTLALELAADSIRVNAICPGPVETERLQGSMRRMAAARGVGVEVVRAEWLAESPLRRFATPEECASVVLFLASDAASAMTGQALNVTAGMMMT